MEIGIFARTFPRPTLDETLEAIAGHGLRAVHFNFACAGLSSLPDAISAETCQAIRRSFENRGMNMAAVSGTFNAIHPDAKLREADAKRCCGIIASAPAIGTGAVTLCTGTRDPDNMWRAHPDNRSAQAWKDLLHTLERLVPVAEEHGVFLGIEPETGNVIESARKARQLLDEMKSNQLKIVMDGANLFYPDTTDRMQYILEQAFDLLGPDILMVHAKDIVWDEGKKSQAAGTGLLDYDLYMKLLAESGFDGPILLHNLEESQVESSLAFVREHAARWFSKKGAD